MRIFKPESQGYFAAIKIHFSFHLNLIISKVYFFVFSCYYFPTFELSLNFLSDSGGWNEMVQGENAQINFSCCN